MLLEPKPAPSLGVLLLYPLAAIAATLVIASLLVLAAGASPFSVFYLVVKGAAGSQFALMETLSRATPLIARHSAPMSKPNWRVRKRMV